MLGQAIPRLYGMQNLSYSQVTAPGHSDLGKSGPQPYTLFL
jgi:hypothetical protein